MGHDSHLDDYLFDNDPETCWEPLLQADARTYEITVSLTDLVKMDGFKIQQPLDASSLNYFPNQMTLEVSKDQVSWENVSYVSEIVLGTGVGEITLLPLIEPGEYRYLRFTFSDQVYVNLGGIKLADIVPYVEE